jgi:hypothetical protein
MAAKHELEIEISPSGKVEVTVKGAKGKRCLDYVQVFASVGKVVDQKATSEMFEPELDVEITNQARTRTGF